MRGLVHRPDVIPNVDCDQRQAAIAVQDHRESVRELELLERNRRGACVYGRSAFGVARVCRGFAVCDGHGDRRAHAESDRQGGSCIPHARNHRPYPDRPDGRTCWPLTARVREIDRGPNVTTRTWRIRWRWALWPAWRLRRATARRRVSTGRSTRWRWLPTRRRRTARWLWPTRLPTPWRRWPAWLRPPSTWVRWLSRRASRGSPGSAAEEEQSAALGRTRLRWPAAAESRGRRRELLLHAQPSERDRVRSRRSQRFSLG